MIPLLLFGLVQVSTATCPAPLIEKDGVCKTQAQLYQSAKCCADSSTADCAIYTSCAAGAAPATAVIKQSCTVTGLDATAINTPAAKAKLEGSIASILSASSGKTVLPSRVTVTGITTTTRRRLAAGAKVEFTVQATSTEEQTALTTAANDIATGTNADKFKEAAADAGGQALSELGSVTAETAAADVQAVVTAGKTVTSALDGQNAVSGTLTATDVDGALTFAITGSVTGDTGTATVTDSATGAYKYTASSASFYGNAIFTVQATDPNGGTTDIAVTVIVPPPPPCDASSPPTNGGVGTCGNNGGTLASGSSCQPTCSTGFTVSGVTSCNDGTLVPATCVSDVPTSEFKPANRGVLKTAVDACLAETPDGSCPIFALTKDSNNHQYGLIGDWDISLVTSLQNIFINEQQFNQDVSNWDTSQVTSMSATFMGCRAFNQDISSWDTSNVVTMHKLFAYTWVFNQDISTWDTSKVTDMSEMFQTSYDFNQDISGWDTGAVTNMDRMFTDSGYTGTLCGSTWESLTGTNSAFTNLGTSSANKNCPCDASTPPTNGGVGTCTASVAAGSNCQPVCDAGYVSSGVSSCAATEGVFTPSTCTRCSDASIAPANGGVGTCTASLAPGNNCQPVCNTGFVSSGVTSCSATGVFTPSGCTLPFKPADRAALKTAVDACISETSDGSCPVFAASHFATDKPYGLIGDWDISLVTSLQGMFQYKFSFNQDLSNWDTSAVTNMAQLFKSANLFDQDISSWDTSKVTTFADTFRDAHVFNHDITGWDTSSATNMVTMFYGSGVTQSFCGGAWESIVGVLSAFDNLGAAPGIISTAHIQCPTQPFKPADKAALLSAVTTCLAENVSGVCTTLAATTVPSETYTYGAIGDWDVSDITDMESLFNIQNDFNADISSWNTSKVTTMRRMFRNNVKFNQDLSGWDTSQVTNMNQMFTGNHVFNADISGWDTSKVTDVRGMFNYAHAFTQDLTGWDTSSVTLFSSIYSTPGKPPGCASLTDYATACPSTYSFKSIFARCVTNNNCDPAIDFAATGQCCMPTPNPDDSVYLDYLDTHKYDFCTTKQTTNMNSASNGGEWCQDNGNHLNIGTSRHSSITIPSNDQGMYGKSQKYCAGECKNSNTCYAFSVWNTKCHFFTYVTGELITYPHVQHVLPIASASKCYIQHTFTKPSGDTTDISADCNTAPVAAP